MSRLLVAIMALWSSVAFATVFGGGDTFADHVLANGLGTGAMTPPANGAATPVFDTGNPETVSWGPTAYTSMPSQTGAALSPTIYLLGQNADDTEWVDTGSRALDMIRSLASATEYDKATAFADGTKALSVDRNSRYASSAVATPTTSGDWVFVLVASIEYSGSGSDNALSWDPGSPSWRARIDINASRDITFGYRRSTLSNGSVRCRAAAATGLRGGKLVMTVIHSATLGRVRSYCNGVYEEDDIGSVVGDGATAVLDFARAPADTSGDFDLIAMWEGDICDTSDECDTTAAEHFARLSGSYTTGAPSTATRASSAYLRKCDPDTDTITYHLVGENWPRREVDCGYSNFSDPTASETTVASFLQEASFTNIVNFGTALDDAAWAKINSATVDANQQDDPAGNPTLDDIDGVTGSGEHGVSQAQTLTAASYVLSAVFKPGNQTFAYADVSSIANVSAYWDSSDCQPDTVGSAATAYGYDLGDLCYIHLVYTGTAASHTHRLLCAEADGDKDYAGAAGDCAYGWVGVAQAGAPPSPILTTSATNVTRSADALSHALDAFTSDQTLIVDFATPGTIGTVYGALLWDGSTSNRHLFWLNTVGVRHFSSSGGVTQVNQTNGTDVDDGARHIFRGTISVGASVAYVDGSSTLTGSPSANPIALDEIYLGQSNTGLHLGGPLYRVRVYDQDIAPGEQGTGDDTP